jgi:hypothetical protein
MHSLCTHYALTMHSLYTHYPLTMHSLCTHYPLTMHSLCTHYTLTRYACDDPGRVCTSDYAGSGHRLLVRGLPLYHGSIRAALQETAHHQDHLPAGDIHTVHHTLHTPYTSIRTVHHTHRTPYTSIHFHTPYTPYTIHTNHHTLSAIHSPQVTVLAPIFPTLLRPHLTPLYPHHFPPPSVHRASLTTHPLYSRIQKTSPDNSPTVLQNSKGIPLYNPSGKYMVKLWANGVPRKVVVDDQVC